MHRRAILALSVAVILIAVVAGRAPNAHAAFHCMRIAAVMGGANGDATIQYVELRMNAIGQNFVGGHQIRFRDAAGALVATFTFPAGVASGSDGASILIATQEFAANATVAPDFVFSASNTVANVTGADVLHPVPLPAGKASFAEGFQNCQIGGPSIVDSVAYGTGYSGAVDYGSKFASDLPASGMQALVVSNLNLEPANNATEYSLQTIPAVVPPGATTPRNNAGAVGGLASPADSDGDGIPDSMDNCPYWPNPAQTLPPWPVPPGDPDCDGWTTADEADIGTNPASACGVAAWPPDFNDDHIVDTQDVLLMAAPRFFRMQGHPDYEQRLDITPDGIIDTQDVLRMAAPIFFKSCS